MDFVIRAFFWFVWDVGFAVADFSLGLSVLGWVMVVMAIIQVLFIFLWLFSIGLVT